MTNPTQYEVLEYSNLKVVLSADGHKLIGNVKVGYGGGSFDAKLNCDIGDLTITVDSDDENKKEVSHTGVVFRKDNFCKHPETIKVKTKSLKVGDSFLAEDGSFYYVIKKTENIHDDMTDGLAECLLAKDSYLAKQKEKFGNFFEMTENGFLK